MNGTLARFGSVATDPSLRAQQSWDTNFRFGSHSFHIGTDEECGLRWRDPVGRRRPRSGMFAISN